MKNFQTNIDKLVSKILNEEIESKVKHITETKGQWEEIDMDEELHGNQSKIDVAEPKGKITAADFKKLRDAKTHKKEVEEYFYNDEEEAEELSQNEPTYVGKGLADNKIKNKIRNKMFGSFDDEHGWFDQSDRQHSGDFDFDYEEEEFEDFPSLMTKHGENQRWFHPTQGHRMFDKYQQEFGGKPFRVRIVKDLEEGECNECGNKGMYESKNKWIQDTDMKKGALHKKLNIPEGDKIPKSKLNSLKKYLMAKAKGDKKLSAADSKLLKQVNMALTLGGLKESKDTLALTENELIDMIENIVKEQIVKDPSEKNNFSVKEPQGLKKTKKAQGESKKENDDYAKSVVKKMKDYMKDMYMGGGSYDENPDDFPQSNYDMEKEHNEMKYHPSDAVEEYIEAFSYPGMTNLVYDEIKPDNERINKQLKGDSTTGNAIENKEGKALGNVSKRSKEVGERFKKNFDENLYGAEQMKASYKRQPQETIEVEGNGKIKGSLKSKQGADKSSSINKATKILNTLESTEDKATKIIKEDLQKMKNLISYNRKTQ